MKVKKLLLLAGMVMTLASAFGADKTKIQFAVTMQPDKQTFHVVATIDDIGSKDFVMPVWTPGYYQRMNFAENVSNFKASDLSGKAIEWKKNGDNVWSLTAPGKVVKLEYDVKAVRAFVASSYLGNDRGYIIPGALFMYPEGKINTASTVQITAINGWKFATGLENSDGKADSFYAPDFDILYDSPILIGPLESLPDFTVNNIPHSFIGYKLGDFDKEGFVQALKKIVTSASTLIGDIPYKKYTFIGIGPGQGGIEHLNSTTISFSGGSLNSAGGKRQIYNFIAHEYFHHYNVKRIRPIELGPFDYKNGSRTNMLWVSEGLSVYYEYLVVRRAGLVTEQDLYNELKGNILAYETKPGRHYQSLVQSSYETWSDGPFGRTEDEVNKTISYYDKGPVVGMLMDFAIRNATGNKKSLDDVMRRMYYGYYKEKGRGFTEAEFRMETEKIAGINMAELFDYTTTTKELDYQKYLNYAGLDIDTASRLSENRYTGIRGRMRNDSLVVNNVDYDSPAWKAGIRARNVILKVDGQTPGAQTIADLEKNKKEGEKVAITILQGTTSKQVELPIIVRKERTFNITRKPQPTALQKTILESWLKEY